MPEEPTKEQVIAEFLKHQQRLKALAFAICRDFHLVDDILQEVSIVLMKQQRPYESSSNFLAWALGVTRYKSYEFVRARKKEAIPLDEEALAFLESSLTDLADQEDFSQRSAALNSCLQELGSSNYRVMEMMYCQKMRAEQIAEHIKRSTVATRSLLQRLRGKMLSCMKKRLRLGA